MLSACRAARSGRILLLAAALLAVAGSFGLHPEPGIEGREGREGRLASSVAPEWNAGVSADAVAHGCLACLAHRSVSLAGLAVFVPASNASHPAPPAVPVEPVRVLAARTVDGRAPPLST